MTWPEVAIVSFNFFQQNLQPLPAHIVKQDNIYDGPAPYHVQYVKLCHLSYVIAARISFADVPASAVSYQCYTGAEEAL